MTSEDLGAKKYTLNSLRDEVMEILNDEGGQDKSFRLGNLAAALMEPGARMLAPATTRDQNQLIIDFAEELNDKSGISNDFLYAIARFLNINLYSRTELISIINTASSYSFIDGVLGAGGGEVIFRDMTNEEIRAFCSDMIMKFSEKGKTDEESRNNYIFYSAHEGYRIWRKALEFIKLDDDLKKTIETGQELGDEFVWEKILKEKRNELQKLSQEERMNIAKKIVNSVQMKRGLPITDLPVIEDIRDSVHFGGQLSHAIERTLYPQ